MLLSRPHRIRIARVPLTATPIKPKTAWHVPSGRAVNQPSRYLIVQAETKNRKKLKHYNVPGHAHYLTFSCYHRFDYLSDMESGSIFMEELDGARTEFQFYLWACVLMPSHVHLLSTPTGTLTIYQLFFRPLKAGLQRDTALGFERKELNIMSVSSSELA